MKRKLAHFLVAKHAGAVASGMAAAKAGVNLAVPCTLWAGGEEFFSSFYPLS